MTLQKQPLWDDNYDPESIQLCELLDLARFFVTPVFTEIKIWQHFELLNFFVSHLWKEWLTINLIGKSKQMHHNTKTNSQYLLWNMQSRSCTHDASKTQGHFSFALYLPWVGRLISWALGGNSIKGFHREIENKSTKSLITVKREVVIFKLEWPSQFIYIQFDLLCCYETPNDFLTVWIIDDTNYVSKTAHRREWKHQLFKSTMSVVNVNQKVQKLWRHGNAFLHCNKTVEDNNVVFLLKDSHPS